MKTKNSASSRGHQTSNESRDSHGRFESSSNSKKSTSGSNGRGSHSGNIARDANGRFKSTK